MPTVAPYGSWRSPIDPETVARAGRRLGTGTLAADGAVWWGEGRPSEQGRTVLMRRPPDGTPEEVTPEGTNVRTRVHEYGGGAWSLAGPGLVLFVDFADQRLYRQALDGPPAPLTPEPPSPAAWRYADARVTADGETVVCVRELHGAGEAENQIATIPLDGSADPRPFASGRDFYSFPRPSPDGRWLAWTCWDHPNMPWDGTELWLAPLDAPEQARRLAGGPEESIFQPEWDPQGRLHFVSDRDGWWNLHRFDGDAAAISERAEAGEPAAVRLHSEQADFAHPQWLFGGATYGFLDDGSIVCVRCERGEERLALLEPGAERSRDLGLPYTDFGFPSISTAGSRVAFAAATPAEESAVVVHDVASGEREEVRRASEETIDPAYVSIPRPIEFATSEGDTAYGFYYPPANAGSRRRPAKRRR